MRLKTPRLTPLADHEWSDEQRELLTKGNPTRVLNIFRTLVRHPDLYRRWTPFGTHVLRKSTLPARDRELVILRIGHLCRSGYEFHQHTAIGRDAGLAADEIERIRTGPSAPQWSDFDRALLTAADELHNDAFITDTTWDALRSRYDEKQMLDLIFAVGQYTMVSMALNSLGVQIEDQEGEAR